MPAKAEFDVVVAGASIAGCAAARLFALAGARVALVERRPDPAAYKVACTHQIQSSAVPAIERLGLAPLLERAGAVRSRAAAWTPYGGWLRFPPDAPPGYGITRRRLDPIVRELALETPGRRVLPRPDRRRAARRWRPRRRRRDRGLATAGAARCAPGSPWRPTAATRRSRGWRACPRACDPHNRFVYFAYWRGVRSPQDQARLWLLDPDAAAVFPNEDASP